MIKNLALLCLLGLSLQHYKDKCIKKDYVPICGGDGRTYKNECYMKAVGVKLAYYGECVNCEKCTGVQALVCANDGKTYTNSCWADCNGAIVVSQGACQG